MQKISKKMNSELILKQLGLDEETWGKEIPKGMKEWIACRDEITHKIFFEAC